MYNEIILVFALTLGAFGTLLPLLPGIPIMFVAILFYGYLEQWEQLTLSFVLSIGLLTFISIIIDYFSGFLGAHKYGASSKGAWGGIAGGFLGIFLMGPIGILLGPFLGVIIGELCSKRKIEVALRAATGTIIGILGGSIIRFIIAIIILVWTIIKIF